LHQGYQLHVLMWLTVLQASVLSQGFFQGPIRWLGPTHQQCWAPADPTVISTPKICSATPTWDKQNICKATADLAIHHLTTIPMCCRKTGKENKYRLMLPA